MSAMPRYVPIEWVAENRAGECFICGKHLGWYWNKRVEPRKDLIACPGHQPSEYGEHDFAAFLSYSDG